MFPEVIFEASTSDWQSVSGEPLLYEWGTVSSHDQSLEVGLSGPHFSSQVSEWTSSSSIVLTWQHPPAM